MELNMTATKRIRLRAVGIVLMTAALAGCATPQEKAADAQRRASEADLRIKQERLKMIEEYRKCIADAGSDKLKADSCERILKGIEALK